MRRSTRIMLRVMMVAIAGLAFLLLLPSLIGLLMVVMLTFAAIDYSSRRYRNVVRSFNAALQAVCHHDAAVGRVALAFSRSGPLSGPCYEFARRLMTGEEMLEAAVMARVPLSLSSAVAMLSPPPAPHESSQVDDRELTPVDDLDASPEGDPTTMPAYGQFIYLTITALVMCAVLGFIRVMVLPTIEKIYEEFYANDLPRQWLFSAAPAIFVLAVLVIVSTLILPFLNRGHFFRRRLPRWLPTMPRLSERRADFLRGMADGIDMGWPIGRILATAHAVTLSTRSVEARSLDEAMRLIEKGTEPLDAVRRAGFIDASETAWLSGAPPQRMSVLLREIADQGVRDAHANLRWMMSLFFPLVVLMLGVCVLAHAFGFFSALTEMIRGLS